MNVQLVFDSDASIRSRFKSGGIAGTTLLNSSIASPVAPVFAQQSTGELKPNDTMVLALEQPGQPYSPVDFD